MGLGLLTICAYSSTQYVIIIWSLFSLSHPQYHFFKDAPFVEFRLSLGTEMKRLLRCGVASKKSRYHLKKRKFCDKKVFLDLIIGGLNAGHVWALLRT